MLVRLKLLTKAHTRELSDRAGLSRQTYPHSDCTGKSMFGMIQRICRPIWHRLVHTHWAVAGVIALLILGLMSGSHGADATLTATVDYAKSGNTLELLTELSPELPITTVRLTGIQAPDLDQEPWGPAARDCLTDLRNQVIRLETDDWTPDAYNRLWAYGWRGRELINAAALEQGCAYLAAAELPHLQHGLDLLYAQESARLLGQGIWNPNNPLRETPETFRQRSSVP
ncbi:MAG: thermonuclease family protein [Leptolyngbyaceae cyanobacterium]